jgi:hypothetical protein
MTQDDASTQVVQAIAERLGLDPAELDLKIQFGKNGRVIFGQLASGEQRREISEDRAGLILTLLKETPAEADSAMYAGKKPLIEICHGDAVLLRQERDGVMSVNSLWQEQVFDLTQSALEPDVWAVQVPAMPSPEPIAPVDQADTHPALQIAQAAEQLINPQQ